MTQRLLRGKLCRFLFSVAMPIGFRSAHITLCAHLKSGRQPKIEPRGDTTHAGLGPAACLLKPGVVSNGAEIIGCVDGANFSEN